MAFIRDFFFFRPLLFFICASNTFLGAAATNLHKRCYHLLQQWTTLSHPHVHLMAAVMLMATGGIDVNADNGKQVLIVANANDGVYADVINGFKAQLSGQAKISFTELFKPAEAALAQTVSQNRPALIFTVGSDATTSVQQINAAIPVISTLVLNDRSFKPGISTGVSLAYPLATQIQWLKKFLPDQTKIAVLYNPAENARTIQTLKKIAEQAGLELTAIPVETPRGLPEALERLGSYVEVLLTIPDEIALSPATIKEVMLASFRNRVPLIGLSENWVKSGALYALTWDYEDLGRQCAAQAQKLLNGQAIKSIPPETPRKIKYAINAKIADHMNIMIANDLRQNAKTTFN